MTTAQDYLEAADALDYANKNQSYLGLNLGKAVAHAIELLKEAAEFIEEMTGAFTALGEALSDD